ncbi:MAG: mandelate racemase/muconate lactonizing enzyme family protein [Rhodobacteraceae bacterium]|nr:mandelate racemase/muconate lactonizing enzyme family protein [Paracoccaceae bacterium]MCY4139945.1 mandelate racemase/muconate lactonizing enzyme family protein [Paracoccaceae bacterium]
MKISDVTCHVLVADDFDPGLTSSAQDSLLVVVTTDDGVQGYGESDLNPWIGRTCIEAPGTHTMGLGMRELLIGRDPREIESIWNDIYTFTAMNGRRGAVIHALGAVEMALWDIAGKIAGKPVWQLLGTHRDSPVVPYASLQPAGKTFEAYRDALCASAENAKELGFRAVKAECTLAGPFAHDGMDESFDRHTDVVAAVREAIGPEITLMVDVQYLWRDADTAYATVRDWDEYDIYFLETPIWPDFLDEHAKLASRVSFPIASGEWLSTRWEFVELIERGGIGVVQPDVGRVGGISEAKAVCEMAAESGLPVVPHCWKTGISLSATAHLAFVTPGIRFIEYLPPQLCIEKLRRELATEDLEFENGEILPPEKPGLGVDINWDAVKAYGQT